MYKLIFLSLFLVFNLSLIAQKEYTSNSKRAIKNYELAINKYNQQFVDEALQYVQEALYYDSLFVEAYLMQADMYKTLNKPVKEVACLKKAIELNADYFPYSYYNYGEALYLVGKYELSKHQFNVFLDKNIGRESVRRKALNYLDLCDNAIQLVMHPVDFNPVNVGSGINNAFDQYWPSLSLDGNSMIYTTLLVDSLRVNRIGQYARQEDFFISYKDEKGWQHGTPIGPPLNTPGNEGAHKLSVDGRTIVFTGCNRPDGFGNCDIYIAFKDENTWSVPVNMGRMINTPFSEKQPCLSPDGRYLYFSSNRSGGKGGMDIWVSEILDGYWSVPMNLGDSINTKKDEVSPFIHPDNSTFYFSSNGHPGLGMKDIFYTSKDSSKTWLGAKNLGYPINTHHDEIGLVVDAPGTKAYYSTNSGSESTNIFEFSMPEEARPNAVSYLSGKIYDAETKKAIGAEFSLVELGNNDTIMKSVAEASDGRYLLCLPTGCNYSFSVQEMGYLFYSENFNFEGEYSLTEPLKIDIPLTKIKVGGKVILNNVFFDSDSYKLLTHSIPELEKLYIFINNNSGLKFEISGYTDNVGDETYNLNLSKKRAESVYNYMIDKGIGKGVILYEGYGSKIPISTNDTEVGRAKNRRTELKIIE